MSAPVHLPGLGGATAWLNGPPLAPEALRGRVVLVDFWTLTCINWLRTVPHVRAWAQAYRDDGLVVLGVHTPEFSFEHDVDLVARATRERGIGYPVVVDNDYAIWSAFANRYWPALYLADREGRIRDQHFGEGRYEETERRLQDLLGVQREPVAVQGAGLEAEADWEHLRTPETYLGSARGERRTEEPPERLRPNQWSLTGAWTIGAERVVLDRADGTIAFRFHARDAHLVLAGGDPDPIPFRVRLDGGAPGAAAGIDVDADGHGVLREGRLYGLVRDPGVVRERTLEITFPAAGAQAYVFTFG